MRLSLRRSIRASEALGRASERTWPPGKRLVLVFNDVWRQVSDLREQELPPTLEVTRDRSCLTEAAAVVFHVPSLEELPPLKPRGQLWVAWSKESETVYPRLADPVFMARFDVTMTYHRDADVCTAYTSVQPRELLERLRRPPPAKSPDRLVAAFVSSRIDQSDRRRYLKELSRQIDVHSYGRYMRNRRLLEDLGRATKLETFARYKFALAFENSIARDYVTEKFFDPLAVGSVPVVLGAPNVEDFAPGDDCYLDVTRFEGPRALAEHLRALNGDDEAYARLHAWRQRPFRPAFVRFVEKQREPAFSRLWRLLEARLGDVATEAVP